MQIFLTTYNKRMHMTTVGYGQIQFSNSGSQNCYYLKTQANKQNRNKQ